MTEGTTEGTRSKITKTSVEGLPPGGRITDTEIDGFMCRRLPSGAITYALRYRVRGEPQRWVSLGVNGRSHVTADSARRAAAKLALRLQAGEDPHAVDREAKQARKAKAKATVNFVLDEWLSKYARKLRGAEIYAAILARHVRPAIGAKAIYDVTRADIVRMLDKITEDSGAVMAERTLAHLRGAFNWWRIRDDKFVTMPIVPGMAGGASKPRERTLTDDEIRIVWKALESDQVPAVFAAAVRVLLYTGQRRSDVADMHTREVDGSDWTIPGERYKTGHAQHVHLTAQVLAMLPKTKDGFVFTSVRGGRAYNGFSWGKVALDQAIAEIQQAASASDPMPHWTLHDLRRTARSLMSRAKIPSDVAELVVGHRLQGVRAVYDRHTYAAERQDAMERLARLLDGILNPSPVDNVVPLHAKA